jgi:hypothetical protein
MPQSIGLSILTVKRKIMGEKEEFEGRTLEFLPIALKWHGRPRRAQFILRKSMRKAIAVLIAVLSGLSSLGAATPARSSRAEQSQAALALIPFAWQQLHYKVVFLGPRPGYRAMTFASKHRIEVYVRPGDDPRLIAYDIAHELGHAIDFTYNTDESRKKWMVMRGIDPSTPWFGRVGRSDFDTPAGDFAETFALLVRGPKYFHAKIAARPTSAQFRQLRSFFPKGFF